MSESGSLGQVQDNPCLHCHRGPLMGDKTVRSAGRVGEGSGVREPKLMSPGKGMQVRGSIECNTKWEPWNGLGTRKWVGCGARGVGGVH
jgi:hypothetical protein